MDVDWEQGLFAQAQRLNYRSVFCCRRSGICRSFRVHSNEATTVSVYIDLETHGLMHEHYVPPVREFAMVTVRPPERVPVVEAFTSAGGFTTRDMCTALLEHVRTLAATFSWVRLVGHNAATFDFLILYCWFRFYGLPVDKVFRECVLIDSYLSARAAPRKTFTRPKTFSNTDMHLICVGSLPVGFRAHRAADDAACLAAWFERGLVPARAVRLQDALTLARRRAERARVPRVRLRRVEKEATV